jgi:defect in organelle trafficking protein DotD
MKLKAITYCLLTGLLASCAHTTKKPPQNAPSDDAAIQLAEAANSVSDSMLELARIEKVVTPPKKDNTLTIPHAYDMQAHASVDWSGPVEELAMRVAKASHYRLRVLGNKPAIPVLVSVSVTDESLAEILRNIDYQAGKKASIHVYPRSKVVELRYAKT